MTTFSQIFWRIRGYEINFGVNNYRINKFKQLRPKIKGRDLKKCFFNQYELHSPGFMDGYLYFQYSIELPGLSGV